MSHPGWCVVVEAHSDEDCHRNLIEGEKCQARVWLASGFYRSTQCDHPAKGWRRMIDSFELRSRPACGIHLRAKHPPVAYKKGDR